MLVPKTDKWVLVRWHGGVRSVVMRKYLMKHLPPGEELKVSDVLKVATSEAGKPDTVTVLTSGNDRHLLDLLSEPGERTTSSDDEQPDPEPEPQPEPEVNEEIEDSEEDFEESSSDWTPDGSPSTEESDGSDSDKVTNKRNKPVSKPSPKKRQRMSTKKSSEESPDKEVETRNNKAIFTKTLDQLAELYIGPDDKKDTIKKTREQAVEGKNNDKKEEDLHKNSKQMDKKEKDSPKQSKQKAKGKRVNESLPDVINSMQRVFVSLFQVIVSVECDFMFPAGCTNGVAEIEDVVMRNNKFNKKTRNKRNNKQTSEHLDKTFILYGTDDASALEFEKNKKKIEIFDKTLTPHESDDEPLATLGKQNTTAPVENKKPSTFCKDEQTTKLLGNTRTSTPVENKPLAGVNTEDDSSDCDYSSDRSDDPVLISNKYETVNTNQNKSEAEWIPIGTGTTLIHKDKFAQVNWKSYTKATRTLLTAAFSRRTLATHSLTGKKSPAFSHKPAKMCLDPKIVSDIVIEVGDKFKVRDNLVRTIITTKCADECKMRKLQKKKKIAMKEKLEQAANETNNAENNNQENLPTPKKTPKSTKKNNRKATPPKTRNTSKIGTRNDKKTPKEFENKTQENVVPPEDDTHKTHPGNEENLCNTKSMEQNEEDMLSSDDDCAMVIDEDYTPPSENNALKSIEVKNQENILPPENRMSIDNNEEYAPSPVNMRMRSMNHENIPTPEKNTTKSINKNQENIPPPVKQTAKGFKTYKNKSKTK